MDEQAVGTREGWARPFGSRKLHYFREQDGGFSLCRKYGFFADFGSFDERDLDDGVPGPEDCVPCRRELPRDA